MLDTPDDDSTPADVSHYPLGGALLIARLIGRLENHLSVSRDFRMIDIQLIDTDLFILAIHRLSNVTSSTCLLSPSVSCSGDVIGADLSTNVA